jgi:hypothetical protein
VFRRIGEHNNLKYAHEVPTMINRSYALSVFLVCAIGRLGAQERPTAPTRWTVGVAWQAPVPADRMIGVSLSRAIWSSAVGTLRIEGDALQVIKEVGIVCVSDPCEGRNYRQSFEALATMSIGESDTWESFRPVGLLGLGAYAARSDRDSRAPSIGAVGQAGLGLRLPPAGARLAVDVLLRQYAGLPSRKHVALAVKINHSW